MAQGPTVVVDCRWLGIGGPGRTTELMLRGLAEAPPLGRWVLWGPEVITSRLAWPDARIVPITGDPRLLLGQRHSFEVPHGDIVLFMHQQRPLRHLPSVTLVYDTIALRHGAARPVRELKRLFLRRIATASSLVLTISEHSKASIIRDLDVPASQVEVLRFPFDAAFVDRVLRLRAKLATEDVALYVGGFLPHKNLHRLVTAFEASQFCLDGGRLLLVGGTAAQAQKLLGHLTARQRESVLVRQTCSQEELDHFFASSLFLVQPSLEEGFGLPAWEALCCGLPVCSSDGGALPEVVRGFAELFPAESVPAMTEAVDECVRRARRQTQQDRDRQSKVLCGGAPSVGDFGAQFRAVMERQAVTRPSA